MSTVDNVARKLLQQWFGKSKVVDQAGNPLVVYRGEHGNLPEGQAFHSRTPNSLSFGDQEAANLYATDPNNYKDIVQAPRIAPGYLKIEKPIFKNPSDPFVEMGWLQDALGTRDARRIARKFDNDIQYTGNWEENYAGKFHNVDELLKQEPKELRNLYFDAYKYLDDTDEVKRMQTRGFDGAMHIGNGATATDMEYRIFDPAQFRSKYRMYSAPAAVGAAGAMGGLMTMEPPQ